MFTEDEKTPQTGKIISGEPTPRQARILILKQADKKTQENRDLHQATICLGECSTFSQTSRCEQKTSPHSALAVPSRKSRRTQQTTLTKALGNPIPINSPESPKAFYSITGTTTTATNKTQEHFEYKVPNPRNGIQERFTRICCLHEISSD